MRRAGGPYHCGMARPKCPLRLLRKRVGMIRSNANTALWLIGLGVLALTGWWWPGILFLVALSALIQGSFQGFIWLAGIGLLALTDFWWPGILIVAGFALLVRGLRGEVDRAEALPEFPPPEPSPPEPTPPAEPVSPEPEELLSALPVSETAAMTPPLIKLSDLPARCPACGGPIDETTFEIRGSHASCGFCGTGLNRRQASV